MLIGNRLANGWLKMRLEGLLNTRSIKFGSSGNLGTRF